MPWGWFQKYPVVLHPITQLNTKHCAKKHPNVCWQIKQNQCWMLKHTDSIELCCVTATEPRADRCTEPYGKHREHKAHHHHSAWEEERSLRTRPPWLCSSLPAGLFPSSCPSSALSRKEQPCWWDGVHFGAVPVALCCCSLHKAAHPCSAAAPASKIIFNLKIRNWSRLRARRLIETKFKFLSSPFKHRGPS